LREGDGHMIYNCPKSGTIEYKGSWKAGRKEGTGEEKYKDIAKFIESSFAGEFKVGVKHGNGILKASDGTIYNGNWRDGMQEGYGDMIYGNSFKSKEELKKQEKETPRSTRSQKSGKEKENKKINFEDQYEVKEKMYEGFWKNSLKVSLMEHYLIILFLFSMDLVFCIIQTEQCFKGDLKMGKDMDKESKLNKTENFYKEFMMLMILKFYRMKEKHHLIKTFL
jgi:hypothetical protein